MKTQNKIRALLQKPGAKVELAKIAREAKMQRLQKLF